MEAKIEWKDDYSVNVKEIDNQHKHFVGIINQLYEAVQNQATDKLDNILADLASYAEEHFSTEEKYFDQFNYENSAEHKEEHRKLKQKVSEFVNDKSDDKLGVCFNLLDFLEDWLVDHLAEQDQKYSKCFNDHGLF